MTRVIYVLTTGIEQCVDAQVQRHSAGRESIPLGRVFAGLFFGTLAPKHSLPDPTGPLLGAVRVELTVLPEAFTFLSYSFQL
jgi:hypothetical protein